MTTRWKNNFAGISKNLGYIRLFRKFHSILLAQNCIYSFIKNERNLNLKKSFEAWNFFQKKLL